MDNPGEELDQMYVLCYQSYRLKKIELQIYKRMKLSFILYIR